MFLGTNFAPPVVHPTTNIVNHTFSTTVVPHIHPVHTTTVNHHMFEHKHYCPQSASCAEEVCNQHINCCNPCAPQAVMPASNALPNAMPNVMPNMPGYGMAGPGFGGPGFGPGPGPGPGFGPGPYMGPRP